MMMPRIIAAALLAAATPLAAGAEVCPTRADLETGIVLSSTATTTRMVSKIINGSLSVTAINTYGENEIGTTMWVDHPLALPTESSGVSASYDRPVSELNNLEETERWSAIATISIGGEVMAEADHTLVLLEQGRVSLSGCSYISWQVRETLSVDNGTNRVLEKVYLPELGIVTSDIAFDDSGDQIGGLSFDQITAE